MTTGRTGRPRVRSLDDVVRTAVAVADAEGLDAVTVRRLAAELGGGPSSLYRLVRSRDELLDLALDSIAREYRLPPPSGDPVEDLVEVGRQARELMLRHPWVADRVVAAPVLGPHGLVVVEHVLAVLDGTPSRGQAGLELFAVLMGLVATEVLNGRQQDPADLARQVEQMQTTVARGEAPHLAAVLAGPQRPPGDAVSRLRRVVAGMVATDGQD